MSRKQILCVCEGGFTRSVCLAGHLKNDNGNPLHDALAVSWRFNSSETIEMLCEWAELIIVMESYMRTKIPPEYLYKSMICDVGPDRYGQSLHPELVEQITAWYDAQGLKPR